jgi:glycosyltransferase involved in cell wall biosynthesis
VNKPILLSIIVPLYNEQESVVPLYERLVTELAKLDFEYELLFVDDGSTDATFAAASGLAGTDRRLKLVKLRRNYGQTPAMAAGIDLARGDVLITMDGDLQNDPVDIPEFLQKIDEGYDIVVGWRYNRQDKLLTRKIPSQIANWLIGKITGIPIKDNGCSLKAYRASIIKHIPLYGEMHRFIPAMTSLAGAKLAELKVRHHPRRYGTSKYGLGRIYKVLLDLLAIKTLVSFTSRPLSWFSMLALPSAVASVLALLAVIYGALLDRVPFSVPLAGTGVLLGALTVILVLSGMLAELVYKTGDTKLDKLSSLTVDELRPKTDGLPGTNPSTH